jgi:hypothetical protein
MALVLLGDFGHEDGSDGLLEDLVQALLCQSGALDVRVGFQLLGQLQALLPADRRQVLFLELLNGVRVVSQIDFGAFVCQAARLESTEE